MRKKQKKIWKSTYINISVDIPFFSNDDFCAKKRKKVDNRNTFRYGM